MSYILVGNVHAPPAFHMQAKDWISMCMTSGFNMDSRWWLKYTDRNKLQNF